MHSLEQRPQALMIFDAGRAFHARGDVDAERPHADDRGGDVVGRQAAREQNLRAAPRDRAAAVQSMVRPVPPRATGSCASSSNRTRARQRLRPLAPARPP